MPYQRVYDYLFALTVIGDSGAGKTCLLTRFVDNRFSDSFISTIGIEFKIKTIQLDKARARLQIWDSAGQSRFRTITTNNLHHIHAAILAFDLTDRASFLALKAWMKELSTHGIDPGKVVLTGTKSDLVDERCVSQTEIDRFVKDWKIAAYFETSAKDNRNVTEAFHETAWRVLQSLPASRIRKIPDAPPEPTQTMRTHLRDRLNRYIQRIDTYREREDKYATGFWMLKASRALNRRINYRLANKMLSALNDEAVSLADIYDAIDSMRSGVINKKRFLQNPNYVERGIQSTELLGIIEDLRQYANQGQEVAEASSGICFRH